MRQARRVAAGVRKATGSLMEPENPKKNIRLTRTSEIRPDQPAEGQPSAPAIRPLRFKLPPPGARGPTSPAGGDGPPVPPAGPPVPPAASHTPGAPASGSPPRLRPALRPKKTPSPAAPAAASPPPVSQPAPAPASPPAPSMSPHQSAIRPSVTQSVEPVSVTPPAPRPPGVGRKLRLRPMTHKPGAEPPPGAAGDAPAPATPVPARPPPQRRPGPEQPASPPPPQQRAMTDTTARPALRKRPPDQTAVAEPTLIDPERQAQIAEGPPRPPKKDLPPPENPLPGNVAVLAFFGAQAVTVLPTVLQAARQGGKLPVPELSVGLGMTLVFAILMFLHKTPLRVLAGLLAFFNLLGALFGMLLFFLLPLLPGLEPFRGRLPGFGTAVGATLLFFAALVLVTGAGPVRWGLALLAVACGLAAPWTPLKEVQPRGAPAAGTGDTAAEPAAGGGRPISIAVATSGSVAVPVPDDWVPAPPPPGEQQLFKSPDGTLTLHLLIPESGAGGSFAEFAKDQVRKLRERYPASGEMLVPVRGRPQWKKVIFASGKDRAEALIAKKDEQPCVLLFSGREDAFRDHRAEIDAIIEQFSAQ